jgi:uncharacterized protein (DUF362 family)
MEWLIVPDSQTDQQQQMQGEGKQWTRRDVLTRGGQAAAVIGLASAGAVALYDPTGKEGLQPPKPRQLKDYFAKVDFPADAPRVSISYGHSAQVDSYEHVRGLVTAALGGLDGSGIRRFVSPGDVVCLKPNVGFDRLPYLAATTNPLVVRTMVSLCLEAGAARVLVADNPIENPPACFVRSGIKEATQTEGGTIMVHSSGDDQPVQIRSGEPNPAEREALGVWPIFWDPLHQADKVIGLPVIKDHNLCLASMTMKNWYGLLGGRRNQFHQAIHNIISDLGMMMRPTLIVADGTRVMMQNGPTGGRKEDVNIGGRIGRPTIVASVDQLACDSWCYEHLLGRDADDSRAPLTYLKLAYQKFGNDPSRIVAPSWKTYKQQGLLAETKM